MDAFFYIGHLIGKDHLDLLKPIFSDVFQRLDEEGGERFSLQPRSPSRHSSWLRDGLATTLLLIAVWNKNAKLNIAASYGQRFADEMVSSLPGLRDNPRLLMSLKQELPLLAEAAPVPLLSALEHLLEGDGAKMRPVFEETEGLISAVAHHTGVLWALETIAWDPAHFSRACFVLAAMAAIDPGGQIANRPIASLREIFLIWNPHTYAPVEMRLAVLDQIVTLQPDIGWELLLKLFPSNHDSSFGTQRPRLREPAGDYHRQQTDLEYFEQAREVVKRAISLADHDPVRWGVLVGQFGNMPPQERRAGLPNLEATLELAVASSRKKLWLELRDELRRHRRFADANWTLPEEELQPIQAIIDKFVPNDPAVVFGELFDDWSYDALGNDAVNVGKRVEALKTVYGFNGPDGVFRLLSNAKMTHLAIEALEAAQFNSTMIEELLTVSIREQPLSLLPAVLSEMYRRIVGTRLAEAWLKERILPPTDPKVGANLLSSWPVAFTTWRFARRMSTDIEHAYWRCFNAYGLPASRRVRVAVVLHLLKNGRATAAVRAIQRKMADMPSALLLRSLDAVVLELSGNPSFINGMTSYELGQLFSELDARSDIEPIEIARREYALLPLLEHEKRSLRLHQLMAAEPAFFHQIVREVYRGEKEDEATSEAKDVDHWKQAYSLLRAFRLVPGFIADKVEDNVLAKWIDQVRDLGSHTDRVRVTDRCVGQVLAHAPSDQDGGWPHRVIRQEIERAKSDDLERGLRMERFNMRGATWRPVLGGGGQERELAQKYSEFARLSAAWPRTAAMLRAIAAHWEQWAEHGDLDARQRRLLS